MIESFKRHIQPLINIYHLLRAVIANVYFGFPSTKLKVIGVTGTDGKTTTTHAVYQILKTAGKKVSMLSTVYAKVGDTEYETGLHVTTPDPFLLQDFMAKAVARGDEYFVLETTSHGLDQNRNFGVHYAVSVITNITHEHLDYHKTYRAYVRAKAKLAQQSSLVLLNKDDQSYELLRSCTGSAQVKTYALNKPAEYHIDLRRKLKLDIPDYNNYNFLAAYGVCSELGVDEDVILETLKQFSTPPGRNEIVYDKAFRVVIDFAHTPNSLLNILSTLSQQAKKRKGRLIHVFGSAGLRDRSKRPLMGAASDKYADISIITEEDYRTESIHKICDEICSGMTTAEKRKKEGTLLMKPNRQDAINAAVKLAKKNDIIVCTGKAHEKSLNRKGREEPWDEFQAVQNAVTHAGI